MSSRTIVITGAFGALGRAVAEEGAARGARLVLIDAAPQPPTDVAARYGEDALLLAGVDLADESAARAAMDAGYARFGRIDALLNIAGTFRWETVEDGAVATWDMLYAVNVKTALQASRAALPFLLKSGAGRIVNVGANGALKSGAGMGAYAASKSGVHRLTESLAEELKGRGVTVNAVMPSVLDTPANRKDMPSADFSKWVTPAGLAKVMLFLASDEARDVTGALLPVVGRV